MNEAKSFASLSSGLLARKGAAKPAMRPQSFGQIGAAGMEDLGWNDMGYGPAPEPAYHEEPREHVPSSIAALTPAPGAAIRLPDPALEAALEPPVVEQQRAIAASFGGADEPAAAAPKSAAKPAASVVPLPRQPQPRTAGAKAAFTLRLDAERHLKLRLACAIAGRSAQQVVTEALDAFLESQPELDTLARQVPAKRNR